MTFAQLDRRMSLAGASSVQDKAHFTNSEQKVQRGRIRRTAIITMTSVAPISVMTEVLGAFDA